jgi:K+/H+ antiporter YhaU regulatory subunit KhtT
VALEAMRVAALCRLVGRTVAHIEHELRRLRIVALPDASTVLETDDLLVVIGEREMLGRLAQAAAGAAAG